VHECGPNVHFPPIADTALLGQSSCAGGVTEKATSHAMVDSVALHRSSENGGVMIFRRIAKSLQNQHWTSFWIEFVILVIGVFLGMQVSNWNDNRVERHEIKKLLEQLQPELHEISGFSDSAQRYYSTTRNYANVAFEAWEGDQDISDEQFVIAAYQASQIYGFQNNIENWALIFGGEQLRNIDDQEIRRQLSALMTADYSAVQLSAVSTRYREDVRRVIPDPIQTAIRQQCGDRLSDFGAALPARCELRLPAAQAEAAAKKLRSKPQLADELRWHQAAVAAFLSNIDLMQARTQALSQKLASVD
jgi:hypothetical protein